MTIDRLHSLLISVGDVDAAQQVQEICNIQRGDTVSVAVFGDFNRGKSTLINALLGRRLLKAKLIPTTGHVTRVEFSEREEIRVSFLDRDEEVFDLSQLDEISTLNAEGEVREDIKAITVSINSPLLERGIILVDTPGRNEDTRQSRRADSQLRISDVVLWILDARQCLHQQEREMTLAWLRDRPGIQILPVLNFMNLLSDDEQAEVRERLDQWGSNELLSGTQFTRSATGKWYFEVNVRAAFMHATNGDPRPADDFQSLMLTFDRLTESTFRDHCHQARAAQMRAILEPVRVWNINRFDEIQGELASIKSDWETRLSDARSELRALEAKCETQVELIVSAASRLLDSKLGSVISWFSGESRSVLESSASRWYLSHLNEAINEIEKMINSAVAEIALSVGQAPTSQTLLSNSRSLTVNLNVGELPPKPATDEDFFGSIATGAIGGFFLGGPLGAIGGAVGGGIWGAQETPRSDADYVAAYQDLAKSRWPSSQYQVSEEVKSKLLAAIGAVKEFQLAAVSQIESEDRGAHLDALLKQREEIDCLVEGIRYESDNISA